MSPKTRIVILSIIGGCLATSANAHPKLLSSNPAAGSSLSTAPKAIRMNFNEGLVPRFTGLELKKNGGKNISTGKTTVDGDNKKVVVPIQGQLSPGIYNVSWHAVSTDTHRVSGQYTFKVTR